MTSSARDGRSRLERLARSVDKIVPPLIRHGGSIVEAGPGYVRVAGFARDVSLGDLVSLGDDGQLGEIVRIDGHSATVKPFQDATSVRLGETVWRAPPLSFYPDESWRGRAINALGAPIDGLGKLKPGSTLMRPFAPPPHPLLRRRLATPIKTGVRAIDMFCPLIAGQRIGLFAGSGVGKSTLLSMLTKSADFDVAVIALVGERGREAREFLEDVLGDRRGAAIAVVSTGDESAMMRRLAPYTALAIAEYFRDAGANVLLAVDSITRFALAAREVALAAGEPPVARGFPPSVFSDLPRLLERAGAGEEGRGMITGFFTVLIDGDDHNDPIADAVRGTLDGHIVLDRAIADQGRYPAINILSSISRLADLAWTPEQRRAITGLKAMAAQFEETRDLRAVGGYTKGADEQLDRSLDMTPKLYAALQQRPNDPPSVDAYQETLTVMQS